MADTTPSSVTVLDHKKHPHARHELQVEVAAPKMAEYFEHAFVRLAPSVEIKGFRKGQAPKLMILQRIGNDRYVQTALDIALPESYADAMQQLKLHPVAPPEVTIESYGEGAPLKFKVAVDVIPDVDLGKYAEVKVKKPESKTDVSKDEASEVLERLRKQQSKVKSVEREAKTGDQVEIDYVGTIKGVKRDDLSSQHFPFIIGADVLPKKLEAACIGKKKGESFTLDDKVDKDEVHFEVMVHAVNEVELPEVDAAFAKQFGRDSADELKSAIHDQLQHEKEHKFRHDLERLVITAVVKQVKVELPKSLVEEEQLRRIKQIQEQLGVMYPKFLEQQKKTEQDIRKDLQSEAEESVKTGLVLGEIAKLEGFGNDRQKGEQDMAFQQRVVRRTIDFLIASATGEKPDPAHDHDHDEKK
jgi:trigger factor